MSLTKVNYIDNSTIITAQNLNDIQDNIIQNAELIKKASPRNLLDNSYFRNPVNLRGVTSFVSGQYGIDRWIFDMNGFTATLQSDGLHFKGSSGGFWLKQIVRIGDAVKIGSKITAVVKKTDGILCATATVPANGGNTIVQPSGNNAFQFITADDGSYVAFVYFGNSANEEYIIEWAALYEGEYTADTLPEYQPRGYETELFICRQYDPSTGSYIGLRKFGYVHNLLDNSDFTNPVNQRGQRSYTGSGYTIDRWRLTNNYSQLGIVSGGVKISCVSGGTNAYPRQYLDGSKLGGKTFTGVACLEDGSINLCTGVFPADTVTRDTSFAVVTGGGLTLTLAKSSGGNFIFQMQVAVNESITVKWTALYEGEYTLDTLPEYQPKGYGAELAECQRYAIRIGGAFRYRAVQVAANIVDFAIPLPTTMLRVPDVDFNAITIYGLENGAMTAQTGFSFATEVFHSSGVVIRAMKANHGLKDAVLGFAVNTIITAEL